MKVREKIFKINLVDFFWMILTGVIALGTTLFIYQFWNLELSVPISYSGDVCAVLNLASNMIHGGGIYVFERVAPLGSIQYQGAIGYILHAAILRIICFFTDSAAVAVNVYFLLGFVLIAMTCFASLRLIGVSKITSMVGGVLYTQLPYHYLRNVEHIMLSGYYMIPLACVVLYYALSGQLFQFEGKGILKSFQKQKVCFSMMTGVLLGCSDIYYSAFFLALLVCASIICVLNTRKIRCIFPSICVLAATCLSLFLTVLPMIIYTRISGAIIPMANRAHGDIDTFGLKWIYLLFPVQNHRLSWLANFRYFCDVNFPNNNENMYVSLGLLLSIGFACSLLSMMIRKQENNLIGSMGLLSLIAILLSGVGSISTLVATLLTTSIRNYNRMSIFIAMFSVISFGYLMDKAKDKLLFSGINKIYLLLASVIMLCIGVWDMTSAEYAEYSSYDPFVGQWVSRRDEDKLRVDSDKVFFGQIQKIMQEGDMILQLPIVSNTIYSSFPNGVAGTWTNYWPYLYTNLRWSHGDVKGGQNDQWLSRVKELPVEDLIDVAVHVGFSGIYIDPAGYEEDELDRVVSLIEQKTGAVAIRSSVGNLYFYNIHSYADDLRSKYTNAEWDFEKMYWLYKFQGYYSGEYTAENLYYLKNHFDADQNAIIDKGNIQYGPYIPLQAGTYEITVSGNNLEKAVFYCTANLGVDSIPIEVLEKTDEKIVYQIELKQDYENVEFVTKNNTNSSILLQSLEYSSRVSDFQEYCTGKYKADELYYLENKFDSNSSAVISGENIQYGPYIQLWEGTYDITLKGENLKNAELRCTADYGKEKIPITILESSDKMIVYRIVLMNDYDNVEFTARCTGNGYIVLNSLEYQLYMFDSEEGGLK